MAKGDFKADPRPILKAHLATYVDQRTGRQQLSDHVGLEVVPILLGGLVVVVHFHLPAPASVGLLTVSGLLSAFLFALMLQVADRAAAWAESHPMPSAETSARAVYLKELAANAGYTSIVSIASAVVFAVTSACSAGWPLLFFSSLGVVLGVHLVLTLLMVMKRVFVLTQRQLTETHTGTGL